MSLESSFNAYPKLAGEHYAYGTAGFRYLGAKLESVAYKVGVLAALRSIATKGSTIGIMITASHNPPADNGVKVIDPYGEMLQQDWEPFATELANTETFAEFRKLVDGKLAEFGDSADSITPQIVLGRDTRESGPALLKAAIAGVKALEGEYQDFGMLTTPQLHYITRCCNDKDFGHPSVDGYNSKLAGAVAKIAEANTANNKLVDGGFPGVTVDTANGIGGQQLKKFNAATKLLSFDVINADTEHPDQLNVSCGADYVKTGQQLPAVLLKAAVPDRLYASFDGDADRVVCYYVDSTDKHQFHLLDGDREATLLAAFISKWLAKLPGLDLKMGIVQTAYANGSSTKYIEDTLHIPVTFTPTGVKHLHAAAQKFDIGVYFEANGHGTVLFSRNYVKALKHYDSEGDAEKEAAVTTLLQMVDVINQTVGDSISDLTAVLIALKLTGASAEEWGATYTELPNKLYKLSVKDRFLFKTTDAERRLVEPDGLQDKIDAAVAKYPSGRSFVRASGTEDAVRVYSEAATTEDCHALGDEVCKIVEQNS